MQLVSSHNGRLYVQSQSAPSRATAFTTGLAALDALAPGGAFERGAVHEILSDPGGGTPSFFALLLATAAIEERGELEARSSKLESISKLEVRNSFELRASSFELPKAIIWSDPARRLYPPAVAAAGVPLERVFILRPPDAAQEVWAAAECLRCRGVAVTLAALPRLTRVEARRLQLAAETGGGVGLLFRTLGPSSTQHAAATRWLVRPAPGERTVQRWSIQLVHGHGGQVGQTILLERHRQNHGSIDPEIFGEHPGESAGETHPVRAIAQLADRPPVTRPPSVRVPA